MPGTHSRVQVLYSFPQKLGADRVCYTAWEQVRGVAAAGADVIAYPGVLHRPLPESVQVKPTLARGEVRIPYRALGMRRACALHDAIVARRLEALAGDIDVVHCWPLGSRRTLRTAARLGIPTLLERPNSHTRHAYEVVQAESERLGVELPRGSEHSYDARVLAVEEEEYRLADRILCPSEFVAQTFRDRGHDDDQLVLHGYGYDPSRFYPGDEGGDRGLFTVLFAGYAAVRKGLHFALDAWLASPACEQGVFLIAGDFLPRYRDRLHDQLQHPSVQVLGQRDDVPTLMRRADALLLPSIEEGSALVCQEAMASGCVPLVSNASSGRCVHGENSLVHVVGDVGALSEHITAMWGDEALRHQLRAGALRTAPQLTWDAAAERLLEIYRAETRR